MLESRQLADEFSPMNYIFLYFHSCPSHGRMKTQPGPIAWTVFSGKISRQKKMNCLELPLTKLASPNKTGQLTTFTSPSRCLPLHPLNGFSWGEENNGTKWQRILGYKEHVGIRPQGFIEPSGRCHRGDWLWRKLTEIINLITQADTEVFVKMSGLWIVPIYLLFDALFFWKPVSNATLDTVLFCRPPPTHTLPHSTVFYQEIQYSGVLWRVGFRVLYTETSCHIQTEEKFICASAVYFRKVRKIHQSRWVSGPFLLCAQPEIQLRGDLSENRRQRTAEPRITSLRKAKRHPTLHLMFT